jgi:hypothetical protein
MDPTTGKIYKDRVSGRKIKIGVSLISGHNEQRMTK